MVEKFWCLLENCEFTLTHLYIFFFFSIFREPNTTFILIPKLVSQRFGALACSGFSNFLELKHVQPPKRIGSQFWMKIALIVASYWCAINLEQ